MLEDVAEKGSHEQWQGPPDVALGSRLPVGHLQQNTPSSDTWWGTVLLKAGSSGCSVAGEFVKGEYE